MYIDGCLLKWWGKFRWRNWTAHLYAIPIPRQFKRPISMAFTHLSRPRCTWHGKTTIAAIRTFRWLAKLPNFVNIYIHFFPFQETLYGILRIKQIVCWITLTHSRCLEKYLPSWSLLPADQTVATHMTK